MAMLLSILLHYSNRPKLITHQIPTQTPIIVSVAAMAIAPAFPPRWPQQQPHL